MIPYSKGYGPTFFMPYIIGVYLTDPVATTEGEDPPIDSEQEGKIKLWLEERGLRNAQWNQTDHEINEEGLPMEGHDAEDFYPDRDECEEYYISNWDTIKSEATQKLLTEKGDQI